MPWPGVWGSNSKQSLNREGNSKQDSYNTSAVSYPVLPRTKMCVLQLWPKREGLSHLSAEFFWCWNTPRWLGWQTRNDLPRNKGQLNKDSCIRNHTTFIVALNSQLCIVQFLFRTSVIKSRVHHRWNVIQGTDHRDTAAHTRTSVAKVMTAGSLSCPIQSPLPPQKKQKKTTNKQKIKTLCRPMCSTTVREWRYPANLI